MKTTASLLLILACSLLSACQEVNNPTAPEADFVRIGLTGQCRAEDRRVECEDSSTTDPPGHIQQVAFRLVNTRTGTTQETQTLAGGCGTAPGLPCEVSFTGLAIGIYEVRHSVETTAGQLASTTYGPLEVN